MSMSPMEHSASLRIGAVEFVSPDEIKVGLDIEAPDGIAANAGVPRAFPRINSYVLIATEAGHIVAQIEWIAVERSPLPIRKGFADNGLVDLPFPLRKMRVNPLGILKIDGKDFHFERGVQTFPSVGEPVLIPTDEQLRSIIESGDKRRVKIGTSPLAANADVCIDPDRLFGRHLAVLGNTGSGKSCSVAGLIQWSLDAARESPVNNLFGTNPNARFIILDPNGEYAKVFGAKGRVFQVGDDTNPLQVPLWFWNSAEWCAFTQASPKAQAPLLKRALRSMRNEEFETEIDPKIEAKRFIGIILQSAISSKNSGEPYRQFPHPKNFTERLEAWKLSIDNHNSEITESLDSLSNSIDALTDAHISQSGNWTDYSVYTSQEINELIDKLREAHQTLGGTDQDLLPKNEDIPVQFTGEVFVNVLEALAQETGTEQYIEFLLARIRTMLADTRMKKIIGDNVETSLDQWLDNYIGKNDSSNGCVTVIDLSLVPAEIIHIVTSVIARMTFEALQRYRKVNGKSLPTVLVMEEAHTFVKRYKEDSENQNTSSVCCQIFEKIAREGRKFGLGLVLSSQRPSELSPTVLSQCNSFLLHRISNDRDQELIHRLVPDNLRGLLRELPSLPSQQAILLGWAAELPIMVRMNDLSDEERPHSDDPDFWDVWAGDSPREINWKDITDDWQMKETAEDAETIADTSDAVETEGDTSEPEEEPPF